MKNYLDLTADNRARRQSEQAFEESHRHNIDTARHAFERLQRTHRRNIAFYRCAKILLSLVLAAAAVAVALWTHHARA